jgi:alanine racemase
MSNPAPARAWVEVSLDALRANYRKIRRAAGDGPVIIPMVKADGYGLGAERVVRALEPLSPFGWGVATVSEGQALRRAGVTRPIIVFGPIPKGDEAEAAAASLVATISDVAALRRWVGTGLPVSFHVEVDTGMGRSGFDWRETASWSEAVRSELGPDVRWQGVYTHFHSADVVDPGPTRSQWKRFQDALAQLPVSREDLLVHACNSAAALRWPEYSADAIRPGIFLYGGQAVEADVSGAPRPEPVATVRAVVVRTREVSPGTTSGYGATWVARSWAQWATLGIGYGDGIPRSLGNRGVVVLRGQRVPIIGRISMDMTVVDISSLPEVGVGEVATLVGRSADAEITLDEVATTAGTISYEILTGLTSRLPRMES